jgi:type II secretory pathway pseudopilin PulG
MGRGHRFSVRTNQKLATDFREWYVAIGVVMNRDQHFSNSDSGFSLLELMLATLVLTVALLGGMVMIVMGMARNSTNRLDSTATNVAQTVLEEVAGAPPNANPILTIVDCAGNNLQITTAPGGPAPNPNTGDINFNQPPVAGYQVNYTVCNNGRRTLYDVRWNVQQVPGGWSKMITVSARQPLANRNAAIFALPPVTLRTVVGM